MSILPKKTKGKRNRKRTIIQILGGLLIAFTLGIVLLLGLFIFYAMRAPAFNESSLRDQLPTKIYDKNNELVTVLYQGQKRESVKFADIPDQMRNAVLATEDNRFYEHGALDFKRLSGAVLKNVTGGFGAQGASTLTQQVIKRSFLTDKKSLERKAQEAYLAYRLEQEYSKNDIFEMYLNKIYYSDGIYGVKTAANYYFNKNLNQLTLAETAYLAGLPQIPNGYNIYDHPEAAEKRKDTVLYLMYRHKRISKAEMEKAQNEKLETNLVERTVAERQKVENDNDERYASYVNVIKQELKDNKEFKGKTLNEILTSGLKIYTNMDMNVQQNLQNTVDNLPVYKNKHHQAAATILDTKTSGLVAISGGRNFRDVLDRNLATDPHPVGSTIKPILSYGPAIENEKWSTAHRVQDEAAYTINGHTFKNYDTLGHGNLTIRDALRMSYNIPALKTFQETNQVTTHSSYNFAKALDLNYKSKDLGPAEALGGGASDFSPTQMAAAFSAFGNGGTYNQAHAIRKVVTQDDETIEFDYDSHKAMEDYTAYMITDMMKDVFAPGGTASNINIPGLNMAAKTGTGTYADDYYTKYNLPSDAAKDVWITGYTPKYAMSVWMGFDEIAEFGANSFVGHVEQALPQTLFKAMMQQINPIDGSDFTKPDSVNEVGNEIEVKGYSNDRIIPQTKVIPSQTPRNTTEAARNNNTRAANVVKNPKKEIKTTEEKPTTEVKTTEVKSTETTPSTQESTQPPQTTQVPNEKATSGKAAADLKAASGQ
ncbi:transglycosylase domain-containing protein [Macrococcus sp. DPC7161]|uniref:transglycosylase domain-containing protein n=1 Tax=Macrococcus sp. DPC7161 TaxID=2507060 RepID=UPI00100AAF15|nr:transglycosylase domain-containing protein [Macrococcus sp. DPC7161]RXK19256.1 penicillin-binding protein [Macrococcus sp. DPC7161]